MYIYYIIYIMYNIVVVCLKRGRDRIKKKPPSAILHCSPCFILRAIVCLYER